VALERGSIVRSLMEGGVVTVSGVQCIRAAPERKPEKNRDEAHETPKPPHGKAWIFPRITFHNLDLEVQLLGFDIHVRLFFGNRKPHVIPRTSNISTDRRAPQTHFATTMSTSDDLTNLPTPPACIADFCIIPLGTPTASVSKEVAQVQRLLKKSGLSYSMHSAGTTVGM
jgi:hypothetical protein